MDDGLIDSLLAAVAARPDDVPLRRHLASTLLAAGRAAEALEHATRVLDGEPDDVAALRTAAGAAAALGDEKRASAYRRLAAALGDDATPEPVAAELDANAFDWDAATAQLNEVSEAVPFAPDDLALVEPAGITFADVGGLAEVKHRLRISFLDPLRNPELRAMYRKSLRGGLLLYGPPGCGKTHIARATAGELGARFISVGISDVLDMYIGQSERNVHDLFELARRSAPCVLFLDEIDALGQKRSNLHNSSGMRTTVNQLLQELDGIASDNEGVFVLSATNHPWDVDVALRRPGRLDRTLLVLPPDLEARRTILDVHLRGRPVEPKVDLAWLAKKTDGYSGADLAAACESAAEMAMEASVASGKPRPISNDDLRRGIVSVRPSTGAWFSVAKNHALYSNESGAYDDLLAYLRQRKLV